jgi:hypothetical protein
LEENKARDERMLLDAMWTSAESTAPKAEKVSYRAESREQRAESREQRT